MGKLEEVRQLAEELGGLKERRRQLDSQIKELESKIGRKSGSGKASTGGDAENQILGILDADPAKVFTVVDVRAIAPALAPSTIRVGFSRLRVQNKIERVRHGAYRSLAGRG